MARRAARALATLVLVVAVGVGAVAGVVWFLARADAPRRPEACTATNDGASFALSHEQADNAALLAGTAMQRGLPARAVTIALATALQESRLENIDYGDRDSLGLFQQRPSQGWGTEEEVMDPVYATGKFYDALVKVDGYTDMEITAAAQAVQRSAFPEAYAQHEALARAWASALTGYSPTTLSCTIHAATAADVETVLSRIERDLGPLPAGVVGTDAAVVVEIEATGLGGEVERDVWAVAQWAVAVAAPLGLEAVEVAGSRWTLALGGWETTDDDDETVPPGVVRLLLGG